MMSHPGLSPESPSDISSDSEGGGGGGLAGQMRRSPPAADIYRGQDPYGHRPEASSYMGHNPSSSAGSLYNPPTSSYSEAGSLQGYPTYPASGVEGWLNQTAFWSQSAPPMVAPWSGPFYMGGGIPGMPPPPGMPPVSNSVASPAPSPAPSTVPSTAPSPGPPTHQGALPSHENAPHSAPPHPQAQAPPVAPTKSGSEAEEVHVPWLQREGFVIQKPTLTTREWWKKLQSSSKSEEAGGNSGKLCFVPAPLVRTACSTVCVSQADMMEDDLYNDNSEHKSPFGCPLCDKTFTEAHRMKLHLLSHNHESPHTCFHCMAIFKTAEELNNHRQALMNSDENSQTYPCSDCGEVLRSPECLRLHALCHSPGWPLLCVACCKVVSDPHDIKDHLSLHESNSIAPRWPSSFGTHTQPPPLINPYGYPSSREAPPAMPGQGDYNAYSHNINRLVQ